ncbi:unnamed protein product [marine sediment metagenome]|uniref:D-glycero-beta-D-manno-heptose 1-phosphate adenylyltransferase n=1 Tax=marine sediment metagenome TaxID=412755 RepID=X1PDV3_9ZZZZ
MKNSKIKTLSELKKISKKLRKSAKKIVFTNGCFDLLHLGHIYYLEKAKKKGDILVVALNSDSSVRRIKGEKRPILPETDRAQIIAALEFVDYVVIFNEATPLRLIKTLKPDVLIKGRDWKINQIVGRDVVRSLGGRVATIPFVKGRSTKLIIKKIVRRFS